MARILCLIIFVCSSFAMEPSIEVIPDKAQLAVGDSCQLTVIYKWGPQWSPADAINPLPTLSTLFIQSFSGPERRQMGSHQEEEWLVTVRANREGAWSLPQITQSFVNGETTTAVTSPEIIVQVGAGSTEANLPPPRNLWTRPVDDNAPIQSKSAIGIIVGIIFVAILVLIWLLNRNRRQTKRRSPSEQFAIDIQSAIQGSDGKNSAAGLARALRRYVGGIAQFDGLGATPDELMKRLQSPMTIAVTNKDIKELTWTMDQEAQQNLRNMLKVIEQKRWAPDNFASDDIAPLVDQAKSWVHGLEAVQQRFREQAA